MGSSKMVTTPIRERVAALEHEQWAHWTRYLLDHLTPENVERWRKQIDTPYEHLSEAEKQSDRSGPTGCSNFSGHPPHRTTRAHDHLGSPGCPSRRHPAPPRLPDRHSGDSITVG